MTPMVFFLLVGLLAAGVVLVVLGRRGWRVNDHPVCRQCTFDLEGVYPGAVTCPECGAGLKRAGFVRIGVRKRLPAVVLVGALIGLLPIAPLAAMFYSSITGANISTYKPLGLLLWEAKHARSPQRAGIAAEIYSRMLAKELDAAQTAKVVDTVLAVQADPAIAWDESWGTLIERAKLDGWLTTEQEGTFRDQVPVLAMATRPRVAAGSVIPISITAREMRLGPSQAFWVSLRAQSLRVGDNAVPVTIAPIPTAFEAPAAAASFRYDRPVTGIIRIAGSKARSRSSTSEVQWLLQAPQEIPVGFHTIELSLELQVAELGKSPVEDLLSRKKAPTRSVQVRTTVEILPKDGPDIEPLAPTPEIDAELANRLRPRNVRVSSLPAAVDRGKRHYTSMSFPVVDLPVPIMFDVFLRDGAVTHHVGQLTSGREVRSSPDFSVGDPDFRSLVLREGVSSTTVDIILRPNLALAAGTFDLTKVYAGEIVIRDVAVSISTSARPAERDTGESVLIPNSELPPK